MTRPTAFTCAWCGAEVSVPHGRGPVPRYCSPAHRQQAFRARNPGDRVPALKARIDQLQARIEELEANQ